MQMAQNASTTSGQLPNGFVSPFKRVQQTCRTECAFACCAMVCGKTLEEVQKMAVTLGYPKHGPAWIENDLIAKIIFNLSELKASQFSDFISIAALPDVCFLMVDYVESIDSGRYVHFQHCRASDRHPSLSYVIDPADWIPQPEQITTNFSHLKLKPSWFIEINPRPNPNGTKSK
jgi:hypothetical protein